MLSVPGHVSRRGNRAPAFSQCLAAAAKLLTPEQTSSLLAAVTAYGAAVLTPALAQPDVCGLLLGLLCHPQLSQATRAHGPALTDSSPHASFDACDHTRPHTCYRTCHRTCRCLFTFGTYHIHIAHAAVSASPA